MTKHTPTQQEIERLAEAMHGLEDPPPNYLVLKNFASMALTAIADDPTLVSFVLPTREQIKDALGCHAFTAIGRNSAASALITAEYAREDPDPPFDPMTAPIGEVLERFRILQKKEGSKHGVSFLDNKLIARGQSEPITDDGLDMAVRRLAVKVLGGGE